MSELTIKDKLEEILSWFIGYPKADSLDPESWEETITAINDEYVKLFEEMIKNQEFEIDESQWLALVKALKVAQEAIK